MIPTLKSIFNTNQVTSLINLLTKNVTELISGKEDVANKQNSLATDVTNTKYPTVTAVNSGLATKLSLSGGTMSGAIAMGTSKITGLGTPTSNQDASTKLYVDTAVATKLDKFNSSNTATGTTSVTINATSGVATFTTSCSASPSFTQYSINNSQITASSVLWVEIYSDADDAHCTKVSVYKDSNLLIININDGGTGSAGRPTVAFQIVN